MMNCEGQQLTSWQMMYNKLLNDYSTLAHHYHQQSETNFTLYHQLQNLLQEKISLLQDSTTSAPTNIATFPSINLMEEPERGPILRKRSRTKREQMRRARRHRIRRNGQVYRCTYPDCTLTYRSSVSMNLHIKIKHNGGTKKQRQALAKLMIDAEEKGLSLPEMDLNLPPSFLDEFKKNYRYTKRYNM